MIVKKSFTLIELMVTMLLSAIVLNFAFSYQFNFLKELKYIEAKEKLAMQSYKATELAIRGFKDGSDTMSGLITLKKLKGHKIDTHTTNNGMEIDKHSENILKINDYEYKYLETVEMSIHNVSDMNNNNDNNKPGIYELRTKEFAMPSEFINMTLDYPKYENYSRLVYTK